MICSSQVPTDTPRTHASDLVPGTPLQRPGANMSGTITRPSSNAVLLWVSAWSSFITGLVCRGSNMVLASGARIDRNGNSQTWHACLSHFIPSRCTRLSDRMLRNISLTTPSSPVWSLRCLMLPL
ncbi:hypothetical protein EMPG_14297 [Blastomyces silverae]|uniref:Uncharacterized protein n=1 Tax=Blastomyces silverae TaxID=2060906 RepID=A0A0H1BMH8_9EURO|nr:hypothetical protein EMPG_14297 [Blastomyces silverae]